MCVCWHSQPFVEQPGRLPVAIRFESQYGSQWAGPWSQPSLACGLVCTCPLLAQPCPAQDPGGQGGGVPSCGGRVWGQASVLAGSLG